MKSAKQKWWIDLILFICFLLTFFLELTGLSLHQWIGTGIGVILLVHLVVHKNWIKGSFSKFRSASKRARTYLILDLLLFPGFYLTIYTGIIMSTWLNLNLTNYSGWYNLHLWSSILTLQVLLLKLAQHWKWIVNTIRPERKVNPEKVPAFEPDHSEKGIDRRAFLRDALAVGAVLFFETTQVASLVRNNFSNVSTSATTTNSDALTEETNPVEQPAATAARETGSAGVQQSESTAATVPTTEPTALPTAIQVQEANSNGCVILCNEGCSYPGRCRRYNDSNGNAICDNTECA
jgi:hypothetical protein